MWLIEGVVEIGDTIWKKKKKGKKQLLELQFFFKGTYMYNLQFVTQWQAIDIIQHFYFCKALFKQNLTFFIRWIEKRKSKERNNNNEKENWKTTKIVCIYKRK